MKKFLKSLVLGLTIFATGCSQLGETTTIANKPQVQVTTANKEEQEELKKKFDSLLATNKDTVGYISIPGTKLSEPIVQTTDNTTYLDKTFEGKNEPLMGAVFMDADNSSNFEDKFTWLFGHVRGNLVSDSRMFKEVMNYMDKDFFNKNPYVIIETAQGKKYYEAQLIIPVIEDTVYYQTEISDENEFQSLLDEISKDEAVAVKKDNLKMSAKDKYVVLSTCLPDDDNLRYNLVLREIPNSEVNEFVEKNKEKLAQASGN